MKTYTGIGSRSTPTMWLEWFTAVATRLEANNYVLRSGGAAGADSAFEQGVIKTGLKDIYLPWKGFNNNPSPIFEPTKEAFEMAAEFHPRWSALKPAGQKFMARNCYQVLGLDLATPTDFIVCWTPNGNVAGGTGQALRMAQHHDIPVFNFGSADPNAVKSELDLTVVKLNKE